MFLQNNLVNLFKNTFPVLQTLFMSHHHIANPCTEVDLHVEIVLFQKLISFLLCNIFGLSSYFAKGLVSHLPVDTQIKTKIGNLTNSQLAMKSLTQSCWTFQVFHFIGRKIKNCVELAGKHIWKKWGNTNLQAITFLLWCRWGLFIQLKAKAYRTKIKI